MRDKISVMGARLDYLNVESAMERIIEFIQNDRLDTVGHYNHEYAAAHRREYQVEGISGRTGHERSGGKRGTGGRGY